MATQTFTIALLASAGLPRAFAWGAMGHEAVAYVATDFVASETKTYFQDLLGDNSSDYLAAVASWADSYRYTKAGKFSAPYHFIDAKDDPPSSCGVSLSQDCGAEGCVVSAIANYTSQLLQTKLSSSERQLAAKMVIHLVGDIGQPLHCEALDLGGNDIDVEYNGKTTNLHGIWDSEIPESIAGGKSMSAAKSWASNLTTAIRSGTYKSSASGWARGLGVADAQNVTLGWAQESNAAVCSTVLAKGLSFVESNDLSGAYTKTATPVVNIQIAKQGYRLAKWLDAIVAAV